MGTSLKEAITSFSKLVSGDLCLLLKTNVQVAFIPGHVYDTTQVSAHNFYNKDQYITLENSIDEKELYSTTFDVYKETPGLLLNSSDVMDGAREQYFHSGLLKSNCRVTSQPDWGDVYIYIKSNQEINKLSLLKYIVSFREECHFHEEICECIYKRLQTMFNPEELFVMCLYARRGGIDINPMRASNNTLLYSKSGNLLDVFSPHVKTSKQ
jgi:7-cyano-7-deazaguanine reductase